MRIEMRDVEEGQRGKRVQHQDKQGTVPHRLGHEPLVEAIWQGVWPECFGDVSSDALAALIFAELRNRTSQCEMQRLPAADIPLTIVKNIPEFQAMVRYRIKREESVLFQVGERVVTVNSLRPYMGWERFRKEILWLQKVLASSVPSGPGMHSLKYLNLLPAEIANGFCGLQVEVRWGREKVLQQTAQLWMEVEYLGCLHTVHLANPAELRTDQIVEKGVLIEIETHARANGSWELVQRQLDDLHQASKALLFQQILAQETIDRLDPEY